MAEKRYQVFVSSTYKDLEEERWEAAKVLLSHDCFVSGMEYFPSTGDEQFEYIKEVIDGCDYYILILGGRYGSIARDGISYTEKEYDYALEKGLKPISFVYYDPQNLPSEKRESDPEAYKKFCSFREKVRTKLGSEWRDINELKVKISESISAAIRRTPGIGWVRGNMIANEDILQENYKLIKKNEQLENRLSDYGIYALDELKLDEDICFKIYNKNSPKERYNMRIDYKTIIKKLFLIIYEETRVKEDVDQKLMNFIIYSTIGNNNQNYSFAIEHESFCIFIKNMQLFDLIDMDYSGPQVIYTLTLFGKNLAQRLIWPSSRTISG